MWKIVVDEIWSTHSVAYRLLEKDWDIHRQQQLSSTTEINLQRCATKFLQQLAVCWHYWGLSLRISVFPRNFISRKAHGSAVNLPKEYVASNQVVGSSNLSGRAIIFKHLAPFRKIESSHKSPIFPQKYAHQGGNRWLGNHRNERFASLRW